MLFSFDLFIKKWRAHPKEAIFFLLLNHLDGRLLLRKLLDSTIGRIIELKHELVNLDFIEYSFIDDVLAEMKVRHGWQQGANTQTWFAWPKFHAINFTR